MIARKVSHFTAIKTLVCHGLILLHFLGFLDGLNDLDLDLVAGVFFQRHPAWDPMVTLYCWRETPIVKPNSYFRFVLVIKSAAPLLSTAAVLSLLTMTCY